MDQSIKLQYTPNQQDYSSVLRLFYWQRRGTRASLIFLLIAFGLVIFAVILKGPPVTFFEMIWLLFPPLFVLYAFFLQPSRMAKKVMQNEQLAAETTWEVSDAGVQISNRFGSYLLEWGSLNRLVTTKDYFLLLSKNNKNAFRFLPRRAFSSPQEEDHFLQLAGKYI
jgi:Ca2+/Na+ antiporter